MATAIISAIESGLGLIATLGSALNTGLTNVFMDSTGEALSNVGTLAFVLFGIGISVGVVKLIFHWITGRHGM